MPRFPQFLAVLGFGAAMALFVVAPVIGEAVDQFNRAAHALERVGHGEG